MVMRPFGTIRNQSTRERVASLALSLSLYPGHLTCRSNTTRNGFINPHTRGVSLQSVPHMYNTYVPSIFCKNLSFKKETFFTSRVIYYLKMYLKITRCCIQIKVYCKFTAAYRVKRSADGIAFFAVRRARVRISARHPKEVSPTEPAGIKIWRRASANFMSE
jgi:hypothetical protein